ncbi:MAG TPA: molybdenum cofactor guanylyltransferase MobA [Xanthobacteraceae bacterium]|nr:molybdenum cofactor guanylyltransferase MobA [Xanthobacteraceae bacterium]
MTTNADTSFPPTLGVLLAGGRAERMGGGDKPLRMIGGETLLGRAAARLAPQCAGLVISANGDPWRFSRFALPVVADSATDSPGPLGGILAALDWMAQHQPELEWLVSAAADCPFLPNNLVPHLHAACRAEGARLAMASSGGNTHPVNALWHVSLRDDLRAALAGGHRKAHRFMREHGAAIAQWPAGPVDPFFNVNTREDLAKAEQLATLE